MHIPTTKRRAVCASITLFMALALGTIASHAVAQTLLTNDESWSDSNGWQVYRNGQLSGCLAEHRQNGAVLLMGFARNEKNLVLGLALETIPGIRPGETQDLKLVFDGRRNWDSQYNGFDLGTSKLLLGGYPTTGEFRRDLERSTSLRFLFGGNRIAQFSLNGSTDALRQASECFDAMAADKPQVSAAGEGTLEQSDEYNNRAVELYGQGRYRDALPFYRRALEIRQRLLGPDDPFTAQSHNNLAAGLLALGEIDEAEENFRLALEIREKAFGPDHPDVAQTLNNLGALLYDRGKYAEAEPIYTRSLSIRERELGPDDIKVAGSLNNLGNLMMQMKRYEEAEPLHQRALQIRLEQLGEDHLEVATSWNNLGNLYQETDKLEEAEKLHRQALAQREKLLGADHPFVAVSLGNLANVLWRARRFDEAEPLFRQSLAKREKVYGPDHPQVASNLNNLGTLLSDSGRYDEAAQMYRRALEIYDGTLGHEHEQYGRTLNNYARTVGHAGDVDGGLEAARKAAKSGYPQRSAYLPLLYERQQRGGDVVAESLEAFQQTAVSASGDALQSLAARFGAQSGELAELVRSRQDMTAELAELQSALLGEFSKPQQQRDGNRENAMRARVKELKDKIELAGNRLEREFPEFAELSRPRPLPLSELRTLMREGEVLIVIDVASEGEQGDYIWAISRSAANWKKLETQRNEITEAISHLREGLDLNNPDRKAINPGEAHALYKALLEPVSSTFGDSAHLIFVLDGPVSSLPPHLLVSRPPGEDGLKNAAWLARDHAITVLPTVSSLKLLRTAKRQSVAEKPFIGFGDPLFDPASEDGETRTASRNYAAYFRGTSTDIETLRAGLVRLPATANEVIAVARSLGASKSDIVLRQAASEKSVKQLPLADYNVVYFATHGLVAGEVELVAGSGAEPALAFTVPDEATPLDDGLLTASEIAQLKLDADWVVMSACNTAAGDRPGADALSGMARAFFYAGARSLLVSHWVVDDAATAELMTRLFAFASSNADKPAAYALRHAMVSLMDDPDHPEWADPIYWSPFILVGEPGRAER